MQFLTPEDETEVVPECRYGISTIRYVKSQVSAGPIYFAARVSNHVLYILHLINYA